MSLDYLFIDDYGYALEIEFVDVDTGDAINLSGYNTAVEMIFTKPPNKTRDVQTAVFTTDGSDGLIRFVIPADFWLVGDWTVRGRCASGTARISTIPHSFKVRV